LLQSAGASTAGGDAVDAEAAADRAAELLFAAAEVATTACLADAIANAA
jgi:hypothetical protein